MMIESNQQLSLTSSVPVIGFILIGLILIITGRNRPQPIADDHLVLLRKMGKQYLKTPQYSSRSYATWFQRQGILSTSAAFIEVL